MKWLKNIPLEALIWMTGLCALVLMPPGESFSVCPVHSLGIGFCPGCGLGKSISYLFRGEFAHSFHAHPLGILAVSILLYRIFTLLKTNLKTHGTNH